MNLRAEPTASRAGTDRPSPATRAGRRVIDRPPFDCIALVLQGGGALGAYQAGVYEALAEAGLEPDWVAGISIGSINSAIIAGNALETRVDKLRTFWEEVTAKPWLPVFSLFQKFHVDGGDLGRSIANNINALYSLFEGAPGFFNLRVPGPFLHPSGSLAATSFYDTSSLQATLERLVDFDRINTGDIHLSLGAVNVRSGNFVYFDTESHVIGPEHVMASGALPPGFPAVEIEGEEYWDGGLVSNTPLQWVLRKRQDTLAFQVDLWSARGEFPRDIATVAERQKEIQYSSRTRATTDHFRSLQQVRNSIARLLDDLPPALREHPEVKFLETVADRKVYNLIQLIYHSKNYEGQSRDYEFSRRTMEEHWKAGYHDARRTLRHPEVLQRPDGQEGIRTFDLAVEGRE
jgi:NTE family protein